MGQFDFNVRSASMNSPRFYVRSLFLRNIYSRMDYNVITPKGLPLRTHYPTMWQFDFNILRTPRQFHCPVAMRICDSNVQRWRIFGLSIRSVRYWNIDAPSLSDPPAVDPPPGGFRPGRRLTNGTWIRFLRQLLQQR